MNDEIRIKQEFRDKARNYVDGWKEYFYIYLEIVTRILKREVNSTLIMNLNS